MSDQAGTLRELLHHDTAYEPGAHVLECGCGTGAQTVILATESPTARITAVDISDASIEQARVRINRSGCRNVEFQRADIFDLPFEDERFDHAFVCFVLEHVGRAQDALRSIRRVLRPGGTVTVIEGDHGSWYCYPQTTESKRVVECLIEVQAKLGGDALIGRRLYPLLYQTGFVDVHVSPRMVHVDGGRPDLIEGFSRNTFIAMVEGVRDQALSLGLIDDPAWQKGIADLYRATEADGTFSYTFFKGRGTK
ncbi:MAG TPA: methyltransferase domain-containing protein [Candidatus Eremiobacteraceae bacterium]|nr:methyltransferase domain-containing protein [Candidatus Eremiobacteraceae bacterium]